MVTSGFVLLCPWPLHAQRADLQIEPIAPSAQARAGVYLLQDGQAAAARAPLQDALAADSALVVPEHGAVAYWLGEAYARTGDSAAARRTWRTGLRHLARAGRSDVRLTDAYLHTLSPHRLRGERLRAVDQYRHLLDAVGPDTSAAVDSIFRRRVAQIEPLLPDDVFGEVVEGDRDEEPSAWTFRAGAGEALQAWWRSLDPFPNTPENERLEEHLTRLVQAQQQFSCSDAPSHLDARGEAHLRFGSPLRRHPLSYQDTEFFREVFRFGVPIPPSGFPAAEVWVYSQIDDRAHYLFVEEDGSDCFQVATANDLLPSTLRYSRGNTERGLNIAYSSLMALRAMYRELALYHIDYGGRYQQIANYANWQEMEATLADMGASRGSTQQTTVGAGVGQTRTVSSNPMLGIDPPTQFVSQIVSRAAQEDRQVARRRKELLPNQHTALHDDTPELPVAMRTTRTLNEDGTTETRIDWGLAAEDAVLRSDTTAQPSTVRFAATLSDSSHTPLSRRSSHYRLPASPPRRGQGFVPAPLTLDVPSHQHHLSLQWTQYRRWTISDGPVGDLGPKRRLTLVRLDSLQSLRATGPVEMSDVNVLSLPDSVSTNSADLLDRATPYPFRTVTPDAPLLLSFELYHLSRDADDQTQYTVSYEVEGRTRRGWTRLFRGQDTQQTATETTVTGSAPRTDETILLDLSQLEADEDQDVRVTVRVTDEVADASVARTVDFVLQGQDDA
ncbi:MAG: GWxTD domain-containing protein [Salinivenus sp.]